MGFLKNMLRENEPKSLNHNPHLDGWEDMDRQ